MFDERERPNSPAPVAFRIAAIGCGVAVAIGLGLVAARLAGIDLGQGFARVRQAIEPTPTLAPSGFFMNDPVRGHAHRPSTHVNASAEDFDVTYHIDALGARAIPVHDVAPVGRGIVEILGCSFTFGHGVADDEPFPAVLQRDHWTDLEVRNRGVLGYGTMQAMAWLDEIAMSEPGLKRVLYGWLDFHVERNGPNPTWLAMIDRSNQRLPLYDVRAGRPVFDRLIGLEGALDAEDPELSRITWTNTEAAIRQMDRTAAAAGAAFHVVLLPNRFPDMATVDQERIRKLLADTGVDVIDLAAMDGATDDALYLPLDGHPNAEWHRRVAAGIAAALDGPANFALP